MAFRAGRSLLAVITMLAVIFDARAETGQPVHPRRPAHGPAAQHKPARQAGDPPADLHRTWSDIVKGSAAQQDLERSDRDSIPPPRPDPEFGSDWKGL